MHWIQRHILKTLTVSKGCRYSELKPDNVDGNLFMYHLKQLDRGGFLKKNEGRYCLTKEGKRFVGGMSLKTGKPTQTPKCFVMTYCTNSSGYTLLFDWNRQPYLGHTSLPFSRLRYGETLLTAAENNLKHKSGLTGKLTFAGTVNIIVNKGDEITTQYLAHIFRASGITGTLQADGLTGHPSWRNLQDNYPENTVDGTSEILKILSTKKSPFFQEINISK